MSGEKPQRDYRNFIVSVAQGTIIGLVTAFITAYATIAKLDTQIQYLREQDVTQSKKIENLESVVGGHTAQLAQQQTQLGFLSTQINEVIVGQRTLSAQIASMGLFAQTNPANRK